MRTIKKDGDFLEILENGDFKCFNFNGNDEDIEDNFRVKIENNKIVEEPIYQIGVGAGAGEITTVIARHIIQDKINNLSENEIVIKSIEAYSRNYLDGISAISLKTGNFFGYGIGGNSFNQACDNNEIELYRTKSYEEINTDDQDFMYFNEWEVHQNFNEDIKYQLDDFYCDMEL